MALHPTPSLSFGYPPPSYSTVDGTQLAAPAVVELLKSGAYVHVKDQQAAEAVLSLLGLSSSGVQHRMDVAHGL